MKRIEFIAPVEAMRGNLSGKQDLLYAENDNPAYDGPVGSVNYARNYSPRFIGAKIAKSGKKYFAVRTKTANHLTAKSKKAMALLGGTGAIVGAILAAKSGAVYTGLVAVWTAAQALGDTRSLRKFASDYVREMLVEHQTSRTIIVGAASVTIDNPWGKFSGSLNVAISNTIRVKFWNELVLNGISFTVNGMKGVAINDGDAFEDWMTSNFNVLNLAIDANSYLRFGGAAGEYILLADDYVLGNDSAVADAMYVTTSVSPE